MTVTAGDEALRAKIRKMKPAEREALLRALAPRMPEGYVPHVPHPPQMVYLLQQSAEAFYGGAAGGGKSDALLMAALQYVDVPGYSALILRRTFSDLTLPGAIMDRADEWLRETPAKKRGGKTWVFPTGEGKAPARLTFGYLQYHKDVEQYRGAEFQAILLDELTQFEERTYEFLFSRLRGPSLDCERCGHPASKIAGAPWLHDEGHPEDCRCGGDWTPTGAVPDVITNAVERGERLSLAVPDRSSLAASEIDGTTLADVPLRLRGASNPGGVGHAWVRDRFVDVDKRSPLRVFVPARIEDNPSLDRRAYRASLSHLSPLEQARLESGDWDAADEGEVFERHWFEVVPDYPRSAKIDWCRGWDLAATAAKPGKDPDWTCGALVGLDRAAGVWYIADMQRTRAKPGDVEALVAQTAASDRSAFGRVATRMEREPGSAGVNTIHTYRRLLVGMDFDEIRASGSKAERARPWAAAAKGGNVKLVDGRWIKTFLDEAAAFNGSGKGHHDDQIDAVSTAVEYLAFGRRTRLIA